MATSRGGPGWLWVVVPMALSALVVGGIAVAVRGGGEDDGESISGPAGELPAVVDAAEELIGTVPPPDAIATDLGRRYGEVTVALGDVDDELAFAAEFDRLPDAEARLVGRTLGEIQVELSPTAVDGAREDSDRAADIVFALQLGRATVQAAEPTASARDQALAVLPFAVQDLVGFEEIAATFASGDLEALATRIDTGESGETGQGGALTEAGAAELISSVANLVSERIPEGELRDEFLAGYAAGSQLTAAQFQERSSGASASQARRPGWRRRTERQSSSGSPVNRSFGSGSSTSQAPASISPSS